MKFLKKTKTYNNVNGVNIQNKVLVMSLSPQFECSRRPNFHVEVQKHTTFKLDRLLIN